MRRPTASVARRSGRGSSASTSPRSRRSRHARLPRRRRVPQLPRRRPLSSRALPPQSPPQRQPAPRRPRRRRRPRRPPLQQPRTHLPTNRQRPRHRHPCRLASSQRSPPSARGRYVRRSLLRRRSNLAWLPRHGPTTSRRRRWTHLGPPLVDRCLRRVRARVVRPCRPADGRSRRPPALRSRGPADRSHRLPVPVDVAPLLQVAVLAPAALPVVVRTAPARVLRAVVPVVVLVAASVLVPVVALAAVPVDVDAPVAVLARRGARVVGVVRAKSSSRWTCPPTRPTTRRCPKV
jgi:hypothetical protein